MRNLIAENQIFGLKIIILLFRLVKEIMIIIMTQMMKKKETICLKSIILKFFQCNPNGSNFDLFKFLGEINLYTLTLRLENAENKGNIAVKKLRELKQYVKNILPNYKN